jgi:PAS domain S-box-containing protein
MPPHPPRRRGAPVSDFLAWLFGPGGFMPHACCYLSSRPLILLHGIADGVIALAYFTIPVTILHLIRKRRDLRFNWVMVAFGVFILACGATHVMEIITISYPAYWLSGLIKVITAVASVVTAWAMIRLMPRFLAIPSADQLGAANRMLESEVRERARAQADLHLANAELEGRIRARTADLERSNAALRESQARYEVVARATNDVIWDRRIASGAMRWNESITTRLGYAPAEIGGDEAWWRERVHPEDRARVAATIATAAARQEPGAAAWAHEYRFRRASGDYANVLERGAALCDGTATPQRLIGTMLDITERKRSEESVRQAQKLESLGVLAGGIAHDFNNLLAAILGHINLASERSPAGAPALPHLESMERTVLRASDLTRQMLAYAGQGPFVVKAVDLSAVARELTQLLAVSIPKKVALRYQLQEGLPAIEADEAQLQQAVMNLVTNAAEAIGDRNGFIVIRTGLEVLGAERSPTTFTGAPLAPGRYVTLTVSDTGCGMSAAVQARIFDPFFTTKFTGRGLGLSAMMGILRNHHAGIRIASEPDKGSTFTLCFPASDLSLPATASASSASAWTPTGTVLLVDDDESVREVTTAMLNAAGFTVIEAGDGASAVALFSARRADIRAVLLDLTMPVMDGREAARELRRLDPGARIILCSGYDAQAVAKDFTPDGRTGFLQKPFQLAALLAALRRVIEAE